MCLSSNMWPSLLPIEPEIIALADHCHAVSLLNGFTTNNRKFFFGLHKQTLRGVRLSVGQGKYLFTGVPPAPPHPEYFA